MIKPGSEEKSETLKRGVEDTPRQSIFSADDETMVCVESENTKTFLIDLDNSKIFVAKTVQIKFVNQVNL